MVWTLIAACAAAPWRRPISVARGADQLLDAGVDVGAIEGEDAGLVVGDQMLDRRLPVDRPVAAGELPAAADDPRDLVAGTQR